MTAKNSKSNLLNKEFTFHDIRGQIAEAKRIKRAAILQNTVQSKRALQKRIFVIEDSIMRTAVAVAVVPMVLYIFNAPLFKPDTSKVPMPTSCLDARIAVKGAMGLNEIDKSRVDDDVYQASMKMLASGNCKDYLW
jgi:hypothetical protein